MEQPQVSPASAELASPRTPPRVVNVPFSMNWWTLLAWGFALVLVAGAVCGGLAFGTVMLIRSLQLSRWATIALLVVGNASLFVVIAIFWYYDRRRKIRRFIQETNETTLGLHTSQQLKWRKLDLFATDAKMFTTRLARAGFTNIVLRVARPRSLAPIEPFTELFEPQPIDEAHPTFRDMTAPTGDDPTLVGGDRDMARQLKRNVTLNGGWIALASFGLPFSIYAISAIRTGSPSAWLYFWAGMLLMFLVAPGARLMTAGRQWLAMPGGILLRTARWRGGGWKLRRLTSENCFMLVTRAPFQDIWFATVSDGEVTARLQFTREEMMFVLRCWLSPLEAPPLERLGELEAEG